VPRGLISVLFGLSPLVTALLARPLLNERGLTAAHVTGMLVALAGLTLIFGASLASGPHMAAGLAALCASVVLQSLSLVLIKRHAGPLPSLSVTAGALAIATPLFFLTWLVFDHHAPAQLPTRALPAMYTGVIGSAIGFTLFFYVLKHVSAHGSALITLITPVLALLLGATINHEHVGLRIWAGTAGALRTRPASGADCSDACYRRGSEAANLLPWNYLECVASCQDAQVPWLTTTMDGR
jgi:drug/metabolite transporter (DMT)-like permease